MHVSRLKMAGTTGFYSGQSTKSSCARPRRVAVTNDSVMYGPSEALVDRNDLSVSLDEFDDYEYDETSSFEGGSFESGLGTSSISTTPLSSRVRSVVTSTPVCSQSSSYRTTQSAHISRCTRPNRLLHSPPPTSVVVMLQEQQALLQRILSEEEEMNKSVKRNNERISVLEAHINNSESSSSNSSSGEKRRLITKDLTDKVNKIHEALEEGFLPNESSLSPFNVSIKAKIIKEICGDENLKYSEKQVKAAVQRKYEALRRAWKIDDEEVMLKKAKDKKYRARRRRKFDNRSLVVSKTEKSRWSQITIEYMSEESDDESTDQLVIHRPQWRSKDLTDLIMKLDERYNDKVKKDGTAMARKPRRYGSPLLSEPPLDAPQWCVNPSWKDKSNSSSST